MMRRATITTLTAAVALSGSVLGLTSQTTVAATAAPAASSTMCAGDNGTLQARVQQLADAFAEGLGERSRKKLMKNKRLWQHGFAPCAGNVNLTVRMASGPVLGAADFALGQQGKQSFRTPLPAAKQLLRHTKRPTLVADVTMQTPAGEILTASQSIVILEQGRPDSGH